MQLESFVAGRWRSGSGDATVLRDATTGAVIASAHALGADSQAMLEHARRIGGPALRALTFHERAALLKGLAKFLGEHKEEFYQLSYATGATKADAWVDIDGGISTLFVYASKGTRELPNSRIYVDGALEGLSKGGSFVGQHICTPLEGAAVHINAFNFPVWGMLEKLAPTLLAGMPAIVKPATQTSYLTERVFRCILAAGLLPAGAVQLVCGGVGDLFEHLTCQDVVSFTGSASTALKLRQHPNVLANSVRFTAETDSLNCSILGPESGPGVPEMDLFVREVVREMTAKAGQKCTAIRRALVPAAHAAQVLEALQGVPGQDRGRGPQACERAHGPRRLPGTAPRGTRAAGQARTRDTGDLWRPRCRAASGRGCRARRLPRPDAAVLPRSCQRAGGAHRRGFRAGVHPRALRHDR